LQGYERLRPNEPNPLDSLGDAHFALGRFREAEQFYLAAHQRAPEFLNGGELLKAAQARLMMGDVNGASTTFNRYLGERQAKHDPFCEYHAATWSWQTGARRAAIQRLDRLARTDEAQPGPLRAIASRADSQLALWLLELGDRSGAANHAHKAVNEAASPEAPVALLIESLAQPGAADSGALPPAIRDYAHAYAALFAKDFHAAAGTLQEIYQRPTNEPDDGLSVLLGWAYEQTGEWQKAAPLLLVNPLPQGTGIPIFSSLYFPRLFYLRGALLENESRRDAAARNYKLFMALSGPDAEIWSEGQRAAERAR
jgi:tetratricopeptide (TPR) repeat protein